MATDNELIEIPFPDLVVYLQRFLPGACDFCGSKQWTVHTNEHELASIVEPNVNLKPKEGGRTLVLGGGAQVIQLQCRHCGQIKYFFAKHILEQIKIEKARNEQVNK